MLANWAEGLQPGSPSKSVGPYAKEEVTTSSSLTRSLQQRLSPLTQGRNQVSASQARQLAGNRQLHGEDAALAAVLPEVIERLDQPLSLANLGQLEGEERLESLFQDRLARLNTSRELFRGSPEPSLVRQGSESNCVLTSTAIALAKQRPQALQSMMAEEGDKIRLQLPNQAERWVEMPDTWDLLHQSCAYFNGLWMTVLSKALGPVGSTQPGEAVQLLTGNKVDGDWLRFKSEGTTRKKIQKALHQQAVVIAGRSGIDREVPGLEKNHSFAVLGFDAHNDRVRLQDPNGKEPVDSQGRALDGEMDGSFAMNLGEFKRSFSTIHYEHPDGGSGWSKKWENLKEALFPSGSGGTVPTS